MSPARMPTRQMNSLSLPPPYYSKGVSHDIDLGRMAARVACLPVSISDGKKPGPLCRQLFRSLDNSIHYEHHGNGSSYSYGNSRNRKDHSNCVVLPLLSQSPPRSPRFVPVAPSINFREFTPPPSPFGSKSSSSSSSTTILKTPSSVRTAETESIASMSPCGTSNTNRIAMTPSLDRTSPVPRTTRITTRPWTPVAVLAKQFHTKKKKNSKNRAFDLHPAQAYHDNSNHSRHSSCCRSNCSSPSLGLDNNDSIHSGQSSYAGNTQNNRRQKVKTELCLYYLSNEICPYGAGCHYAHGEEELQTKGLLDLQNRGLIEDASTYRVKPCFSHVAMGSW